MSREPSKTYKPSSMTCIRNMYYQVTGHEQDPQASNYTLVGICNSGTDIHERVQKYVADMVNNGIDCEYINVADYVTQRNLDYLEVVEQKGMETKLYNKVLNMSFLCDGIIRYKNKYYILELKTESSYKWQGRKGVDPKHYAQGTAYSLVFKIDDVIFVYINRDILDMKSFMFTPTDEMRGELVNKILECDNYVAQGIVPPKPEDVPKSSCEYCSYRNSCRSEPT
jgi:CRISPR/Cas system-associated exonuclease Cas4 (RecB family)